MLGHPQLEQQLGHQQFFLDRFFDQVIGAGLDQHGLVGRVLVAGHHQPGQPELDVTELIKKVLA